MSFSPTRSGPFPETPWTHVHRAAGGQDTLAGASLETVCRMYWAPLYAVARRDGLSPAEAEDVTQSFFAQLLEDETLKSVDPTKGRLRSYLLTAMKHFISNWRRSDRTIKRGGEFLRVDFDTSGIEAVCAQQGHGLSPDEFFERRWAATLLNHALESMEQEMVHAGKQEVFAVLGEFILAHGKEAQHGEAAKKLGMNEGAARVAVHRLRKRYRQLVREHVAATVGSEAEVDDELRHLISLYAA